jgi:hypothetical protein
MTIFRSVLELDLLGVSLGGFRPALRKVAKAYTRPISDI